jgi:hypothetical protein
MSNHAIHDFSRNSVKSGGQGRAGEGRAGEGGQIGLPKPCSFAWCGSSFFFFVSVLVCVLVLLHFFLLVVVSFIASLRVLFSSCPRVVCRLRPWCCLVFLLLCFPLVCDLIEIGVFVFGAYCLLLRLWIRLVTLFLVSFPVSELVLLVICCLLCFFVRL